MGKGATEGFCGKPSTAKLTVGAGLRYVGKGSVVGVAAQLRVGSQLPLGTQLLRKPTVAEGELLCDTVEVVDWVPERELAPLGLALLVMEPEADTVLDSDGE